MKFNKKIFIQLYETLQMPQLRNNLHFSNTILKVVFPKVLSNFFCFFFVSSNVEGILKSSSSSLLYRLYKRQMHQVSYSNRKIL
jgi:hypothetical protein